MKNLFTLIIALTLCSYLFAQEVGTSYTPVVSQSAFFDISEPIRDIAIPPQGEMLTINGKAKSSKTNSWIKKWRMPRVRFQSEKIPHGKKTSEKRELLHPYKTSKAPETVIMERL